MPLRPLEDALMNLEYLVHAFGQLAQDGQTPAWLHTVDQHVAAVRQAFEQLTAPRTSA